MHTPTKWTTAAAGALALTMGASTSLATVYTFGSDNDGLAGFTQSASANSNETWSTLPGSVQYRNQDAGTLNSSFLRAFTLDRTVGRSYTFEGSVTLADGYTDDNNRVGMYFFGDAPVVPNEDELGALGLIFNTDDSSINGPPGNDAVDSLRLMVGIDQSTIAGTLRNQATTPYAQDLFGTTITLGANITFVNDGTNDLIQVDGYMVAAGDTTTLPSQFVLAADYTGDYFGFVTRARARNYVEGGANSPEGRSLPWVMEYESLSVIPEPSTFGLVALMGGALLCYRRRATRT